MDKFPRDTQNELLMVLYDSYPDPAGKDLLANVIEKFGNKLLANIFYLIDHQLISPDSIFQRVGPSKVDCSSMKITTKGIDFIRDDGGLSAVLNVTTIKIHNETIDKLEKIIKQSSLTAEQKDSYLGKLQKLPAEITKHLVLKLVDLGLSRSSDVLELISSYIQP